MVNFEAVQDAIPELKGDHHQVVVVGYPLPCPGTNNALNAINMHPRWKGKSVMVEIPRHEVDSVVRTPLGYHGTMPMVFVRDSNGQMEHVGGGSDLLNMARSELEPQYV